MNTTESVHAVIEVINDAVVMEGMVADGVRPSVGFDVGIMVDPVVWGGGGCVIKVGSSGSGARVVAAFTARWGL